MASAEPSPPPPLPLLALRSRDSGAQVLSGLPSAIKSVVEDAEGECRVIAFSASGERVAWCNSKCIKIYSLVDNREIATLPKARTTQMEFSPLGTYLTTWELYGGQENNDNVTIWRADTGEAIKSYIQKKHDGWQPQWQPDDGGMATMVSTGVWFFKSPDIVTCVERAKVPDIAAFALAPTSPVFTIAAFIVGKKGMPSSVRLYTAPNYEASICNKSFYNADRVSMTWNKQGSAVLVNTMTDVDKSGQSYYGETHMYYMATKDAVSMPIMLDKNGPIYDCCWAPNGKEFAVCYGFMPAKVALFNEKCDIIKDYGTGPRSVVSFNPSGTILCTAGFGNLRGDMEFWERKTHTCISKLSSPDATVFAWCPDSRHIVTATCSPRLKVDNNIKVFHYTQGRVWKMDFKELWAVAWQPVAAERFPPRPTSPVPVTVKDEAKAAPAVYRPPGARGAPASFMLHEPTKPAADAEAANKPSKSQIKKQKAKAKAEAEAAKAEEDKKEAEAQAAAAAAAAASAPPDKAELEKKVRNLKKKLRAVEETKAKQASGAKLEKEQEEKLASEAGLKAELEALERTLATL